MASMEFWHKALGGEMAVIRMYESALPRVKDAEAKKTLQLLISESKAHALVLEGLLGKELGSGSAKPMGTDELTKFLDVGLDEEVAMEALYRKTAARMEDDVERRALLKIADDETRHQAMLKAVAASIMDEQD